MHGVAEDRLERRLKRARRLGVERDVGDAEARRQFKLPRLRGERAVAAIELEPAVAAQIALAAGLGDERLVLGDCARKQRPHQLRGLDQPCRLRCGAERREPRRDLRQKREMIVGFRRALERDAQERRPVEGKACGKMVLPSMIPVLP